MADGFELFHIPQQSRRDKLRVLAQNNPNCESTATVGSTLSSNLLSFDNPSLPDAKIDSSIPYPFCVSSIRNLSSVNFTGTYDDGGFINNIPSSSSSSAHNHQPYLSQQSSVPLTVIPCSSSVHQDINNNPLFPGSTSQTFRRDFDQSFNGGNMVTFKPEALSSLAHHDTTMLGHGLSLSLSSQKTHQNYLPLRPFTGYTLILKGSRFLKPAKQLLEEIYYVGRPIVLERNFEEDSSFMDSPGGTLDSSSVQVVDDRFNCSDQEENQWRKTRLISILDEVYQRYKQYYQQIQAIVGSFESVSGLENAAPNIKFSLSAMSKHFRYLKNMITGQLRFTNKVHGEGSSTKHDEAPNLGTNHKVLHNYTPIHQNLGIDEHHVWRPQRGLPQRAVAVLRAWLFEHFLHPYPTDTDKQMLAKQTGLSRSQVSNWFINARVRLWKPMVEEVHMLETLQPQRETQNKMMR